MVKKLKYVFFALMLMSLILGNGGCSPSLPGLPTSLPPKNSSEYTNPSWMFPSRSSQALPLPSIAEVIAEVMPSVVSVTTEMIVSDLFGKQYTQPAAGSGVVIDSQGYIVTNNHVVANAKSIEVELIDRRTFRADIVGTDALTDLAVLKIESADLPHASLGDSDLLAIGDWVVAIGNALGEGISATHGIVSRLNVSVPTQEGNTLYGLIQTDAAINPGNSGGPLVNIFGEVVGITSAKLTGIAVEGMGYAISIDSAESIIQSLINQGYVTRPWLGVQLYTVDAFVAAANKLSVDKGALLVKVVANSPATNAGLEEGDVIIRFDGKEITNTDDLVQAIRDCQPGQEVEIIFVRGEDTKTTSAQLQESPPPWD